MTLKNTLYSIIAVFLFTAFGLVTPAHAFKPAVINNEFAQVKQTADPNSATTSTLAKGTRVNTSDKATNGFYKVRAANASGWVSAADLSFSVKTTGSRPSRRGRKKKYQWEVKVFTGLNFWTPTDVNTLVGSTSLNMGTGIGGEIGYAVNSRFNLLFRIEHLSKTTSGTDTSVDSLGNQTVNTIELDYAATPIMVGGSYNILPGDTLSLDASALIGLASPTLTGIINSATAATFSGSSPCLLIKADLNWLVGDSFWLFSELGYRYLKTKQIPPANLAVDSTGAGPGTFFESNGQPVPIALDMSGPVFNIGARLNF